MYKEQIRAYLSRSFSHEFSDDEDLFGTGLVNEQFPMQIATFLESQFGIRIEDHEYNISNFRSVDAVNAFVERKKEAG